MIILFTNKFENSCGDDEVYIFEVSMEKRFFVHNDVYMDIQDIVDKFRKDIDTIPTMIGFEIKTFIAKWFAEHECSICFKTYEYITKYN